MYPPLLVPPFLAPRTPLTFVCCWPTTLAHARVVQGDAMELEGAQVSGGCDGEAAVCIWGVGITLKIARF
jgi:hypothetical protein